MPDRELRKKTVQFLSHAIFSSDFPTTMSPTRSTLSPACPELLPSTWRPSGRVVHVVETSALSVMNFRSM
ncbi:hypothetical protein ElyMa_000353500, partial [Elysia marginata]